MKFTMHLTFFRVGYAAADRTQHLKHWHKVQYKKFDPAIFFTLFYLCTPLRHMRMLERAQKHSFYCWILFYDTQKTRDVYDRI